LKSIKNWHRYVDYEHIWVKTLHSCDGFPSITDGSYDFKIFAQYRAYLFHYRFMIISKQHSNLGHTPRAGPESSGLPLILVSTMSVWVLSQLTVSTPALG
jgi:hypothetical protein